ncbi:MAG: response regulator, partial [Chlorobiaceae bacterium]
HEGSGLGLSISKAYVAMLGGSFKVKSTEGTGSTFSFNLPFNPVHTQPSVSGTQHSALRTQHSEHCILIVEDDEVSTLLLKRNLKGENITMLCAENGLEAVEVVQQHPEINLVLMDLKMPIMNGFEATKLIKHQRPELPVIAQSAFTSKEDKEKAKEAGCDNFITKPISKSELLDMMAKLLV